MNKQLHFNKLLHDEKFVALAIDQGTSLKDIIKKRKGKVLRKQIIIISRSKSP
tara:strand:- start:116 stop:274 length:159 start_codon:yes stop_codon:yes gene_type:complete